MSKNKENAAFVGTTNSDSPRRPLRELQIQACDLAPLEAETLKRKSRWAADIEFRLTLFEQDNHGKDRNDQNNCNRNADPSTPEIPDLLVEDSQKETERQEGALEQIWDCSDPHDRHIAGAQLQLKSALQKPMEDRPDRPDQPTLSDLSDLPSLPSFGGRNLQQLGAEILQNEQAYPERAHPSAEGEAEEDSAASPQVKEKRSLGMMGTNGMRGMTEVDRTETKTSSPDFSGDLQLESELACDSSEWPEWPTPPESPILERKQRSVTETKVTQKISPEHQKDQGLDVDDVDVGENVDDVFSFARSKGDNIDEETLELPKSSVEPWTLEVLEALDAPKVGKNESVDHFDNFDVDAIDTCLDNTFDSEAQSILQSMMCISQLQSTQNRQNRHQHQPLSRAAKLISARALKADMAEKVGQVIQVVPDERKDTEGRDGREESRKETEASEALGENARRLERLDLDLDLSSSSSTSSLRLGIGNLGTFGSKTLEPLPSWNFDTLRGYLNTFQRSKLRQQQREARLQQLQKQSEATKAASSKDQSCQRSQQMQKLQKRPGDRRDRSLFRSPAAGTGETGETGDLDLGPGRRKMGELFQSKSKSSEVEMLSPRRPSQSPSRPSRPSGVASTVSIASKTGSTPSPSRPSRPSPRHLTPRHPCRLLETSKSVPLLGPMQVHSRGEVWLENRKKRQYLLREEARKEELRECTFKPQLSETPCFKVQLPSTPRSPRSPKVTKVVSKADGDRELYDLYDRQMQWRRRLDERWDEERQRKKQMELQEEQEQKRCQSCPKMSKKSKNSCKIYPFQSPKGSGSVGSVCSGRCLPRAPREVDEAFERFHERTRQWQAARELRVLQAQSQCTCELRRPTIQGSKIQGCKECKDEKDDKDGNGKGGKACTQSCVSLKPREPKGSPKDTSKTGKRSTKSAKEAEANTKCRARSEEPKCRDTPRSKAERQEVLSHLQALRRALFDSKQWQDGTLPRWQKALQVEVARSHGAGAAPRAASRGL